MPDDPSIDPKTGILGNIPGLRTQKQLDEFEAKATRARIKELKSEPHPGKCDAVHFKAIHAYIFQDVYEWAGQPRTINAPKLDPSGATRFTHYQDIETQLQSAFERLAADSGLRGLTRAQFVEKTAELLGDLNHIHTFREGNGRAQKCFVEHLATQAGHSLDFSLVSEERMIVASIAYEAKNPAPMKHLLTDIADPVKRQQLSDVIEFFDRQGYKWQHRELACVQPGETYTGQMVGRKGNDLLFHDGRHGIWIGNYKDLGRELRSGDSFTYTVPAEQRIDKARARDNPVPVALTERQTRLILASEYSNDRQVQDAVFAAMREEEKTIEVMGGRVNLDYDGERKQFYATVDRADRSAVVQRFRQIEAKAQSRPAERFPGRGRGDFEHE
jgi:fido (protein-threonine AMPylation protein)